MFIPHHPVPMMAVRYFPTDSALNMGTAAKANPAAADVLMKRRRLIIISVSHSKSGSTISNAGAKHNKDLDRSRAADERGFIREQSAFIRVHPRRLLEIIGPTSSGRSGRSSIGR